MKYEFKNLTLTYHLKIFYFSILYSIVSPTELYFKTFNMFWKENCVICPLFIILYMLVDFVWAYIPETIFCVFTGNLINYLPDKDVELSLLSSRLHTAYGTSFEQGVMLPQ